jgi:hypothetical protein
MTRFTRGNSPPDNGSDHLDAYPSGDNHRPAGHGAHEAVRLFKERELDLRRKDHRFLSEWKEAVISDLGGQSAVNNFQLAMVNQAVSLLIILGKMSEYVEAHGVMEGNNLTACLRTSFLAYQNTFRLALISAYSYGGKKLGKKSPNLEDYLKSKEDTQNEGHPDSEEKEGEFTQ